MIKKALLILLVQVLLYTLFIKGVDLSWVKHQSFEQSNLIKSEAYLFEATDISSKSAIIGTSLSAILTEVNLPDEYVNLAFHGQSMLAGFDVIKNKKEKPKVVFIEMNMVLLAIYDKYYKSVQNPYSYYPKKYLPILRQKARPVEMIGSSFFEIAPSIYRKLTNQPDPKIVDTEVPENTLKASHVAYQKTEFSIAPTMGLMDTCFQLIAPHIKELEEQGICIVFYEVPIEKELCKLTYTNHIRERFYKEYPTADYQYIQQPNCQAYKTTDGLHLTLKSAKKYATYFLEQVKRIKC